MSLPRSGLPELATARTCRLRRKRRPTSQALIAAAMVLTGCGASPQLAPAGADAPPRAAEPGHASGAQVAQLAQAINRADAPPPSVAPATPVTMPSLETSPTGLPPSDGASYADRVDAMQLADELARRHDMPADWSRQAIAQARHRQVVTRLIMPAASPGAKNWTAYRSRFIEPQRLRAGQRFWLAHASDLQRAEARYGVPAHIMAGVIGVETLYGRDTGRFRVLDALTTLSLDFPAGRSDRSAFFRQELGEFLMMCREQGLEPSQVLGSFAGAIGWPQFMPSSIRRHGVDFDGDGRIDLRHSPADAIGSVANFLAAHGWQAQWPTHFSVKAPTPGPELDTLLAPDIRPTFTPGQMQELGAVLPQAAMNHPGPLALVLLHNAGKPPTLIAGTRNFYAITRYNQSSYYALAVIELGQTISGLSPKTAR